MKVKLVKIGNSVGVRLPKAVLKDCDFGEEAVLEVQQKKVVLSPLKAPRKMWAETIAYEVNQKPLHDKGEWQW